MLQTAVFVLASGFLLSCKGVSKTSSSFLIIAVDQLAATDLDCSHEPKRDTRPSSTEMPTLPGIENLCSQSVGFSHVYTTSLLSQPALTSLLTGQYPLVDGVRNNSQYLSPSSETVAERAYALGYDTVFISGGAPILRKSGLSQGFAFFDDYLKPSPQLLFRPFKNSVNLFKARIKENLKANFFSMIYVPDLRFINQPTRNRLGEMRNLSFESQLEEFDEGLTELTDFLKSEKKWDTTNIIIVGLNGRSLDTRKNIPYHQNLHSENTQVALLWKPASPLHPVTNLIHEPISLADLGTTFFSFIDHQVPSSENPDFQTLSIAPLLKADSGNSKLSTLFLERWIPIESAWSSWHEIGPTTMALRKSQFLCFPQKRSICFNTVADKEEQGNVLNDSKNDVLISQLHEEFTQIVKRNHFESSSELNPGSLALNPLSAANIACLKQFRETKFENLENIKCDDPLIQELIAWLGAEQNQLVEVNKKEMLKKKFLQSLYFRNIDRLIFSHQMAFGRIWDVPSSLMVNPDLMEQIFELPDYQKIRAQASRALNFIRDDNN